FKCILLTLIFTLGFLISGCSSTTNSSAKKGTVQYTLWYPRGGTDGDVVLARVTQLEKAHPNIKIKIQLIESAGFSEGKLRSGIDENNRPKTLDEIKQLAAKVDKIGSNGEIQRIAFVPTLGRDGTDYLNYWAAIFGGKVYSEDGKKVVFNKDPNVLQFVKWLK